MLCGLGIIELWGSHVVRHIERRAAARKLTRVWRFRDGKLFWGFNDT